MKLELEESERWIRNKLHLLYCTLGSFSIVCVCRINRFNSEGCVHFQPLLDIFVDDPVRVRERSMHSQCTATRYMDYGGGSIDSSRALLLAQSSCAVVYSNSNSSTTSLKWFWQNDQCLPAKVEKQQHSNFPLRVLWCAVKIYFCLFFGLFPLSQIQLDSIRSSRRLAYNKISQ